MPGTAVPAPPAASARGEIAEAVSDTASCVPRMSGSQATADLQPQGEPPRSSRGSLAPPSYGEKLPEDARLSCVVADVIKGVAKRGPYVVEGRVCRPRL